MQITKHDSRHIFHRPAEIRYIVGRKDMKLVKSSEILETDNLGAIIFL